MGAAETDKTQLLIQYVVPAAAATSSSSDAAASAASVSKDDQLGALLTLLRPPHTHTHTPHRTHPQPLPGLTSLRFTLFSPASRRVLQLA
jgi:hypothetical protein